MAATEVTATTVRVRFRPCSANESGRRCVQPVNGDGQVAFLGPDGSRQQFAFDKIYHEVSQDAVFGDLKFIVHAVLEGKNGTILAYGQTGSGKTHTLIGDLSSPAGAGIVPRAVEELADGIGNQTDGSSYEVKISVLEIYCEKIRDLLDPANDNLQVSSSTQGSTHIDGASVISVAHCSQLVGAVQHGLSMRTVKATACNEQSSRSHCIVNVVVERKLPDGSIQSGKLCMVDLAGSERQDKTGAVGQTAVEGSQINKSLSCLANVIYALTDEKAKHVPYRDSKLTRVLQDSLGGTARTVLIICCSPCLDNAAETLSSLRFGSRAKGVTNMVRVNQKMDPAVMEQQLEALRTENEALRRQLASCAAQSGQPLASGPQDGGQVCMEVSGGRRRKDSEERGDTEARVERLYSMFTWVASVLAIITYFVWEDGNRQMIGR